MDVLFPFYVPWSRTLPVLIYSCTFFGSWPYPLQNNSITLFIHCYSTGLHLRIQYPTLYLESNLSSVVYFSVRYTLRFL